MPTQKDLDEAARAWQALDLDALRAMTDEEITAAALSDPDAQPLTDDELDEFKVVRSDIKQPPFKNLRKMKSA